MVSLLRASLQNVCILLKAQLWWFEVLGFFACVERFLSFCTFFKIISQKVQHHFTALTTLCSLGWILLPLCFDSQRDKTLPHCLWRSRTLSPSAWSSQPWRQVADGSAAGIWKWKPPQVALHVYVCTLYIAYAYCVCRHISGEWNCVRARLKIYGANITSNHIAFYCSIHFRRYHQFFFVYILDVEPTLVQPHHSRLSSDHSLGARANIYIYIYIYMSLFFFALPPSPNERTLNQKKLHKKISPQKK